MGGIKSSLKLLLSRCELIEKKGLPVKENKIPGWLFAFFVEKDRNNGSPRFCFSPKFELLITVEIQSFSHIA